ncbi:MAG TPA: uroporphyrinogen-III C-methyltransferase [Bacteroidia bacterium]|jgi:uroporphyrin-III C-methyltransferase|nr:uroporphyrinogen-III C-methyltransferase [Bacteroidia bacterium]HRG53302.1 uroporphyrinogen-III C-methyltransferase [Bacteroidia bacterium]
MSLKNKIIPRITLVGAGPGDPELITIKGVKAIATADVILYDALVNPELLKHAPADALKIYVGKRNNQHTYTQDQINLLLVDFAFSYGHVVRLKGGDPFVFGRGHEEVSYAELFNIPTTVIPGLSSSIAVPELQGIPVTNRGTSESFWVITGTTSKGQLSNDIRLAAQSTATVVILMGLSKLREITEVFKAEGKQDTAVAVIQNGSLPNERIALGTIDTIVDIITTEKLSAPAVIVVGDVVKLHTEFPVSLTNWEYLLS